MSLIDETKQLEELMEAQAQLKHYAGIIDKIANKCHGNAAAFSRLESERLRHQTRANTEAVRACELEDALKIAQESADHANSSRHDLLERIDVLERVAQIAQGILMHGDLQWHTPLADRITRESELRDALSCLPNPQDHQRPASGAAELLGGEKS